ncbi:SAV_2336 N-terminal domain-related protein [Kitasatospora sp. NPDC004615]|uniref:SAV_2336 N-terminal domain-related protein n=1 Tax=Kitasatospora sp. NPDC004615 TaxID=3364017 RepID=UPI003687733F
MTGARPLELLQQALAAAGADLTARELAEAVWLAGRLPPRPAPTDDPDPGGRPGPRTDGRPPATHPGGHAPPPPSSQGSDVYAAAGDVADGAAALPVLVPDGRALPAGPALARSLRPLRQRVPSRRGFELDERATADLAADTGILDPVLRPRPERRFELALVVDDGLSMHLWQELSSELRTLLGRSGAFRRMRSYGLDSRHPDGPRLRARPFAPAAPVVPSGALCPADGRGLVLVLSDTVGAHWRGGGVGGLLGGWARRCPTAVLQPLPQRLWPGTGLRTEPKTLRAGGRPGVPNSAWQVADPILPPGLVSFTGLPVPVLELSATALAEWTGFLVGGGELTVRVAGTAAERPGAFTPAPAAAAVDMRARLAAFRAAASPEAFVLAGHLAAVRPLTLPVMRLVQQAVLRGRGSPAHLAEVLLGGLVRRAPAVGPETALPSRYDFRPGLRELLLETVPARAALDTAAMVTGLVRGGDSAGRYVPALRAVTAGTAALPPGATAFAEADTPLFRHFAPATTTGGPVRDVHLGALAARDPELAALLDAQRWQQAVERGEQVLEELLGALGPDHPEVLGGRFDLAGWIGEAGSPQTALRLCRELLAEFGTRLGDTHPQTLTLRARIAHWSGRAGDPAAALAGYRALLPDQERVLGEDHPECLYSRHQSGFWLGIGGDRPAALEAHLDLLPRQRRVYGEEHRETLRTRANIASLTGLTGHTDESLALWQALLPDLRRVLGPDDPLILTTEAEIAYWGSVNGDPADVLRLVSPLIPRLAAAFGPHHPTPYGFRLRVAQATGELGDPAGAVALLRELLADLGRWLTPEDPVFLGARADHAYWTALAGDVATGLRQLRDLLPELEGILGTDHPDTRRVGESIAYLQNGN